MRKKTFKTIHGFEKIGGKKVWKNVKKCVDCQHEMRFHLKKGCCVNLCNCRNRKRYP